MPNITFKQAVGGGLICLLLVIVVSLVLIETTLRVTNFNNVATFTVPCVRATSIPGLAAELTPNCVQVGTMPYNLGVEMRINSCGFRGPEEECGLLSSSSSLIFVTGDSYTNAGNVSLEDSYVKVAERKMDGATLLNIGVAAASIDQKIVEVKYFLDNYSAKPKAVVLQWLLNDNDASLDINQTRGGKTKFKIFLRQYFFTYRFVAYMKQRLFPASNTPNTFSDVLEYRRKEWETEEPFINLKIKLCDLSQFLEKQSIKRVFLNPPLQEMLTDWKEYEGMESVDKRINSIAEDCGWTVVWPAEELKKYPVKDVVLDPKGDHHPNILGNRIIGEVLGSKLQTMLQEN